MVELYATAYCGLWVQAEAGEFWLVDDRGCDEYCGTSYPSAARIAAYAAAALEGGRA